MAEGFLSPQPTMALKVASGDQSMPDLVVGSPTEAVSSPTVTEAVSQEP